MHPQGAQSKLKDLYTQAQESAARTWVRLDSEYSLSSKAEKAGRRVEETWRDVDQVGCWWGFWSKHCTGADLGRKNCVHEQQLVERCVTSGSTCSDWNDGHASARLNVTGPLRFPIQLQAGVCARGHCLDAIQCIQAWDQATEAEIPAYGTCRGWVAMQRGRAFTQNPMKYHELQGDGQATNRCMCHTSHEAGSQAHPTLIFCPACRPGMCGGNCEIQQSMCSASGRPGRSSWTNLPPRKKAVTAAAAAANGLLD
eukprot:1097644-Pelagomonas_calceolata.AAC.5